MVVLIGTAWFVHLPYIRLHLRIDVRLGAPGDLQHAAEQTAAARARRESLADHRFEHRLHLARRSGQQDDRRPAALSHSPGAVPFALGSTSRRAAPSPGGD